MVVKFAGEDDSGFEGAPFGVAVMGGADGVTHRLGHLAAGVVGAGGLGEGGGLPVPAGVFEEGEQRVAFKFCWRLEIAEVGQGGVEVEEFD